MKKFLVLYQAPVSAMEQMAKASPEQAAAGMEAWMAWNKKVGSTVVDLGMPVGNGTSLANGATSKSTSTVAGFSIMQGESATQITELLKDHPHLQMPGASIELLEALPMPGM